MTIKADSFIIYISQNVTGKGSDGPGYARFRFGLHYCLPGQVEIFFLPGQVVLMLVFSIGFTKYAADCSHWCCFWCFPPSANVPISEGAVLRGALPSQVHLHITRWEIKINFSLKVLSPVGRSFSVPKKFADGDCKPFCRAWRFSPQKPLFFVQFF